MRRRAPDLGSFLDGTAGTPLTEPPPLPPPAALPRRAGTVGTIEDCVRALVAEFRTLGGGLGAARLANKVRREWHGTIRTLAADLMDESLSPVGFVRLAVGRLRARQGKFPVPEQVFGARVLAGWLEDYRRGGAAEVGLLTEYTATPERVALHGRRYDNARLQAEPGHRSGDRQADGGGPRRPPKDPPLR